MPGLYRVSFITDTQPHTQNRRVKQSGAEKRKASVNTDAFAILTRSKRGQNGSIFVFGIAAINCPLAVNAPGTRIRQRIGNAVNDLEKTRKCAHAGDARGLGTGLLDDDRAVRETAVAALIKLGPGASQAVPELRAVLRNEASDIRRQALLALSKTGPAVKAAAPELAHIATHVEDEWTLPYGFTDAVIAADGNRRAAAEILDALGPDAAEGVPELCGALRDPRTRMRQSAAHLLGRIGPKAKTAVPELRYALTDPATVVRESAAEALRAIDPGTKDTLPEKKRTIR